MDPCQGGVDLPGERPCGVLSIALSRLWLWASECLLSLKALHILGLENRGVNLISRGCLLSDEWRAPKPLVVGRFGPESGKCNVDLFATRQNTHCPL